MLSLLIYDINPELLLRGSSPTPGASDVGSTTKRNKNKHREFVFVIEDMRKYNNKNYNTMIK